MKARTYILIPVIFISTIFVLALIMSIVDPNYEPAPYVAPTPVIEAVPVVVFTEEYMDKVRANFDNRGIQNVVKAEDQGLHVFIFNQVADWDTIEALTRTLTADAGRSVHSEDEFVMVFLYMDSIHVATGTYFERDNSVR